MANTDKRTSVSAASFASRVLSIADKLSASEHLKKEISDVVTASETKARGPAALWFDIGYSGNSERILTADEIAELPKPGSANYKRGNEEPTTNNPDYYKTDVGGKEQRGSFYGDLALNYSTGKLWAAELAQVKAAIAQLADTGKNEKDIGDPGEYGKGWKLPDLRNKADQLNKRLNNLANALRNGVELGMALARADEFDEIEAVILTERDPSNQGKPKVRATQLPIRVRKVEEKDFYKDFTVGAFVNVNWDKVAELGGDWDAFLEATKRGKKTEGGPASKDAIPAITGKNVLDATSAFVTFLEHDVKTFDSMLKGKGIGQEESDLFVWNLFTIYEELMPIVNAQAYKDRFDAIDKKMREERKAARTVLATA